MTSFRRGLIAALALLLAGGGCVAPGPAGGAASGATPATVIAPPLRSVSGGRRIGAALESRHLGEPAFATVLATNFNSLTPENEMKWTYVEPSPGQFAFRGGDALVAFAAAHDMRVRGHTLVWHTQLPPWVRRLSGEALRRAQLQMLHSKSHGHPYYWAGFIQTGEWANLEGKR